MRYALYCIPLAGHRLLKLIEPWFARSAYGVPIEAEIGPFSRGEHGALTATRARYGFHATMKAPFHLAQGFDADTLPVMLKGFATRHQAVNVGRLQVARFENYLALAPVEQPQALTDLAQAVVETFQPACAPLSDDDFARRNKPNLSERERELLYRWGYPATEEHFKFHMTLAGPVEGDLLDRAQDYLNNLLAPAIAEPFILDTLALFTEPNPPGSFNVIADASLIPEKSST